MQAEGPTQDMKSKLEMLEESLAETKNKTDEEIFSQNTYHHMLDRMKKDFIAARIQSSSHDASLKNKS